MASGVSRRDRGAAFFDDDDDDNEVVHRPSVQSRSQSLTRRRRSARITTSTPTPSEHDPLGHVSDAISLASTSRHERSVSRSRVGRNVVSIQRVQTFDSETKSKAGQIVHSTKSTTFQSKTQLTFSDTDLLGSSIVTQDEVYTKEQCTHTHTHPHRTPDGRLKFLSLNEVPQWARDNPFIFQGYRNDMGWKDAFRSLWHLHNETLNVWTHSIACIIMFCILILIVYYTPHNGEAYAPGLDPSQRAPLPAYCFENPLVRRHEAYLASLANRHTNDKLPVQASSSPLAASSSPPSSPPSSSEQSLALTALQPLTAEEIESLPAQCRPHAQSGFDLATARRIHAFFKSLPHQTRAGILRTRDVLRDALYRIPLSQRAFLKEVERARSSARNAASALRTASLNALHDAEDVVASARKLLEDTVDQKLDDVSHLQEDLVKRTKIIYGRFANFLAEAMSGDLSHLQLMAAADKSNTTLPSNGQVLENAPPTQNRSELLSHLDAAKEPLLLLRYLEAGQQFFETLAVWPIVIFLLSAMLCFGFSAVFHLFAAVSHQTAVFLNRLDYAGISLLIGGSNVPIIYYAFYCYPTYQSFYIAMIGIGCLGTFIATVHPKYSGHEFRAARAILFIILGLFGVIPFVHVSFLRGFDKTFAFYLFSMGATYIGGAAIYVTQVPERCAPGRFDIWCSSHQLWHVMTFIAAMFHYFGVRYMYQQCILNVCEPPVL